MIKNEGVFLLNHYEVLRVKPTASQTEIKKAYRVLAKKFHPDTYKGDKSFAEEKMQEINRAYDVLSNVELRKSYDMTEGIFNEETVVGGYRTQGNVHANEENPYKTYNDMSNVRYHHNHTNTYYDKNGYARANYTPYSEEDFFEDRGTSKFISFHEFITTKKWVWLIGILVVGLILFFLMFYLFLNSLDDTMKDFQIFQNQETEMPWGF